MLGGTDRGYDFDTLLQRIEHSNVSTIILFPDTGAHISLLLSKHHKKYNLIYTSDMSQAV
jgi:UDP-N-acetylmuramoylalanine-D-glutamate ligase